MIEAHGHAALRMLAEYEMAKGRLPPRPARAPPPLPPETFAMWVRMWQHHLSVWLHLTMSRQVLRYLAPSIVVEISYS